MSPALPVPLAAAPPAMMFSSSKSATAYSSSDAITSIIQSMLYWSRCERCRARNSERKLSTFSTGAPMRRYMARLLRMAAASRERCRRLMMTAKRNRRMMRSRLRGVPAPWNTSSGRSEVMNAPPTMNASPALIGSRR